MFPPYISLSLSPVYCFRLFAQSYSNDSASGPGLNMVRLDTNAAPEICLAAHPCLFLSHSTLVRLFAEQKSIFYIEVIGHACVRML